MGLLTKIRMNWTRLSNRDATDSARRRVKGKAVEVEVATHDVTLCGRRA